MFEPKIVFYEGELTDYQKTIYGMAIAHSYRYSYVFKDADIYAISSLLNVDYELLNNALHFSVDGRMPAREIKLGTQFYNLDCFKNAELLNAIVRCYWVYKSISELSDGTSDQDIIDNYNIFKDCIHQFECMNAFTATLECMDKGYFTLDYTVFNNNNYSPIDQIEWIYLFLTCEELDILDRTKLPLMYRTITYDLLTHVNSIYMITVAQIIKHSPFVKTEIKQMAEEMYSYLLRMVRNARVISVESNFLFPTNAANLQRRGKSDNTTRLQILYGYENYDSYYLRLDLAHKGQRFIHYNNKSPGGTECCLFTSEEYHAIIDANSETAKFFIQYGNRYALKELINLPLTDEEYSCYEQLCKLKHYDKAFQAIADETELLEFLDIVSSMLPQSCHVGIDKEEKHAQYCFNLEKIMFQSKLLESAMLQGKESECEKLICDIVSKSVRYKLITSDMIEDFLSFEGICYLIDEAFNRVPLYKDNARKRNCRE